MILKILRVDGGIPEKTNCYIIQDENTKETMVIDPGGSPEKIIEMLDILEAKVKYLYLTHCHGDHIRGLKQVKDAKGGKILIHRFDSDGLNDKYINLSELIDIPEIELEADSRIDDKDLLHLGNIEFQVIHTPGHTKGGSSLYCEKEKMLFTGDTIFRGTWGRTDLPTGSFEEMIHSISYKLMVLPDDVIIYPGHGKSTMVREEEPIYLELGPRKL